MRFFYKLRCANAVTGNNHSLLRVSYETHKYAVWRNWYFLS